MEQGIYRDIAMRTGGDIYIGVVGPVRTGKSTFIKKFMEKLVIPHIDSEYRRERAKDELPQSAAGKTIMTTEPKFIPEEAAELDIGDNVKLKVRLIDCVGYIVPSSLGYIENEMPRMVRTPWFEGEVPFNMAAEVGTQKVINEHSTIGLVITSDGSISDIPREEYEEAHDRVIGELNEIKKPFVVLINCKDPNSLSVREEISSIKEKHGVDAVAVNCLDLEEEDICKILEKVLYRFPIRQVEIDMPKWVTMLDTGHWLKSDLYDHIKTAFDRQIFINELPERINDIAESENVLKSIVESIDLGTGIAKVVIKLAEDLFYKILGETTGLEIDGEAGLMPCMIELADIKRKYERVASALEEVEATGYGIVMPTTEELTLEEPEIVKQGGRYGVRLKAEAPSIHMMKASITTEVSPIVGSEKQSEELVMYLLNDFEENPQKIWESNIFGKSLHELVNEGLHNKLYRMPSDARLKLQETIEKIINEGCNGLICIII
ncbi:MAG: stage IV sporulation protein A [Oscillospiraceae bacterium]|nr:stage IV sporulation protein A [Oscillospiraceae bacterium]